MKKAIITVAVIVVLLVIIALLGPFYILQEGEQSVITRFGAIVKVETFNEQNLFLRAHIPNRKTFKERMQYSP